MISQSFQAGEIGSPMEELKDGPEELKGFTASWEEQ